MDKNVQTADIKLLSSIFSPDDMNLLLSKSTVVKYHKRETVVKKGEFLSHMVLLTKGYVKVETERGNKNLIYDIVSGPNIPGLPAILSWDKFDLSIVSLSDCEVRFLEMDVFKKVLRENGNAAMELINYGNNHFLFPMLEKLQCISHNNVRGRLAHLLISLTQIHDSKAFTLLITRTEMAQMIGFSRENVIRILSEFHNEGVITISGKHIEVKDMNKLNDLALYS